MEDAIGGKDVRDIDAAEGENIVTTDTAGLVSAAADVRIYSIPITLEVSFCNKSYF